MVKKHLLATNQASDGESSPRSAVATGRSEAIGATPKPHAGSSDGRYIDRTSE